MLCTAGGYSTDRAEETIMEAPKVPTLDLKHKRKPATTGSVPMATDDDDRNLSVIDPGGNYGPTDVSLLFVVVLVVVVVVVVLVVVVVAAAAAVVVVVVVAAVAVAVVVVVVS